MFRKSNNEKLSDGLKWGIKSREELIKANPDATEEEIDEIVDDLEENPEDWSGTLDEKKNRPFLSGVMRGLRLKG